MNKKIKYFLASHLLTAMHIITATIFAIIILLSIMGYKVSFTFFYIILFVGGLWAGVYIGWYSCRYLNWDYPEWKRKEELRKMNEEKMN